MPVTDKFFSTLGGLGDDASHYSSTNTGSGITQEAITDPTGSGYGTVGKFGLSVGDKRCELSGHVDRDPTFGTDYWTWISVYVPATWQVADDKILWFQIHEQPDTSPADYVGEAQLIATIEGRRVRIENNFDVDAQTVAFADITSRVLCDWPLDDFLGRWTDIVIRVTWSVTSGGALRIWRNRRQVFQDAATNNAYNNAAARGGDDPFHKLGIYRTDSGNATVANYLLHRGLKRGTGYSTFDTFMAACGSSDTELEGFVTSRVSL